VDGSQVSTARVDEEWMEYGGLMKGEAAGQVGRSVGGQVSGSGPGWVASRAAKRRKGREAGS
jgi:hypothetical protein